LARYVRSRLALLGLGCELCKGQRGSEIQSQMDPCKAIMRRCAVRVFVFSTFFHNTKQVGFILVLDKLVTVSAC